MPTRSRAKSKHNSDITNTKIETYPLKKILNHPIMTGSESDVKKEQEIHEKILE
jgi:hypothetical protein